MSTLEEQIDVSAPAQVAWDCLHNVATYPEYVDGIRQARPEGKRRAHLDIDTGGRTRAFDAEITDRAQGQVMLWHTTKGAELKGAFSVLPIDDGHAQVQIRLEYDPAKTRETFGGPKGFAQSDAIQQLVRHDLEQFKAYVEGEH
jgi:uncharacterized membrane protein